jgi:hypothetical protein
VVTPRRRNHPLPRTRRHGDGLGGRTGRHRRAAMPRGEVPPPPLRPTEVSRTGRVRYGTMANSPRAVTYVARGGGGSARWPRSPGAPAHPETWRQGTTPRRWASRVEDPPTGPKGPNAPACPRSDFSVRELSGTGQRSVPPRERFRNTRSTAGDKNPDQGCPERTGPSARADQAERRGAAGARSGAVFRSAVATVHRRSREVATPRSCRWRSSAVTSADERPRS